MLRLIIRRLALGLLVALTVMTLAFMLNVVPLPVGHPRVVALRTVIAKARGES